MNELLIAATRLFNAAAALMEAALEKEHGKKADAAPGEPVKAERKPRAAKTEVKVDGDTKTTTTDNGNGTGSVSVGPATAPVAEKAAGNAVGEKFTTETARPRVLAVAHVIGSQAVKDIIKRVTGSDLLAKVPVEKLAELVAEVEKAGAEAAQV